MGSSSSDYQKPLPTLNETNRPYWEAAARDELVIPTCANCGAKWFPRLATAPNVCRSR